MTGALPGGLAGPGPVIDPAAVTETVPPAGLPTVKVTPSGLVQLCPYGSTEVPSQRSPGVWSSR